METRLSQTTTRKLYRLILATSLLTGIGSVAAQPFVQTRYVKIDHGHHTAYIYDENFQRLPDSPVAPGTSFDPLGSQQSLWYLGAKVDVVRRTAAGAIEVLSHDPAYYEMVHHFTWVYHSDQRAVTDPCGYNRPLAAGSELADIRFPAGYAYKLDGGFWSGGAWHWANPAGVPHDEAVYLRFSLVLDDNPGGYRDVNVTWVDSVPCESDFAIPAGESVKAGPVFTLGEPARIVAIYPHVHDHATHLAIRRNGKTLRKFRPAYAAIPVAHDDVGEGPTPLHSHEDHLPSEGLTPWTPGIQGSHIQAGDTLTAYSRFDNPHPRAIDNMALFVVVWERAPANVDHGDR